MFFNVINNSLIISSSAQVLGKYQEKAATNSKLGDIDMDDSDYGNQETSAQELKLPYRIIHYATSLEFQTNLSIQPIR